jgi:hypothetical protein
VLVLLVSIIYWVYASVIDKFPLTRLARNKIILEINPQSDLLLLNFCQILLKKQFGTQNLHERSKFVRYVDVLIEFNK